MNKLISCSVLVLLLLVAASCQGASSESGSSTAESRAVEWAIVIHGGAGAMSIPEEERPAYLEALTEVLQTGKDVLMQGGTSLDAVEQVVRHMEDDPKFNAGRGAVFTHEGANELDASIMDGSDLSCGAVTGVKTVKNPISLARRVMEQSPHVFFAAQGAEHFAGEMGVERVDPEYFFTQRRYDALQKVLQGEKRDPFGAGRGTVGAAALDQQGNLAAATSTGGITNKRFGRIGDSPVIGAGTYADNRTCAISCTGKGEEYIRRSVAHDISALMAYKGVTLQEAVATVVFQKLRKGDGGVIGVAHDGSIAMEYNTRGMLRGAADSSGRFEVKIFD